MIPKAMVDQILKMVLDHFLANREKYLKMAYDAVMGLIKKIDADHNGKADVDEFLADFNAVMPGVDRISARLDALKKEYIPKK